MREQQRSDKIFVVIITLISIFLYLIPTGFPIQDDDYVRSKAKILAVDNQNVHQRGVVKTGVQGVSIEIMDGIYKGERVETTNTLLGKLEMDKLFQEDDVALVVIKGEQGKIQAANLIDHYRLDVEGILFALFALVLFWYARWTGVKALLSFIFTILILWKVLWPLFLKGWDPIIVSQLVVCLIVGCVTFLIAGLNRVGVVAFLGTISGTIAACIIGIIFGDLFKVHGAVVPFAETLLHVGFSHIDLTKIFLAGIFLASSGAMMDVAMDIAVSVAELVEQKPSITRKEVITSGMNVGRAVVGTMTTTLLLAYSGAFTALMMVFMAQGTAVVNILNLTYIAAEILHTLVGSFGVVLVAPFTAILAGWLLVPHSATLVDRGNKVQEKENIQ
ncbi:YibE/F family protein [Pelosinus fermentans]|uniref:YibE/F family protein n=1 Tax=Pelosinus fermentans JBW45 TaxID=1192197 RepID=I8TTN3_9FIRM|nr:YibE/F family protein [Pelosinus fermentans]AJQ29536.1 YibE/F family protein [Pelosinus fermentans JBW45]